jgi:hypothetical protein
VNQRAILPKFVVGVVVAVICIVILFGLGGMLFRWWDSENDLQKVEKNLEYIKAGVEKARERGEAEAWIYNPTDWAVTAWPGEINYQRPDSCSRDKYCVCICEDRGSDTESFLESCSLMELCIDLEGRVQTASYAPIYIDDPPIHLELKYFSDTDKVVIREIKDE